MISKKKFLSLKPETRLRKLWRILYTAEALVRRSCAEAKSLGSVFGPASPEIGDLLAFLAGMTPESVPEVPRAFFDHLNDIEGLFSMTQNDSSQELLRRLNSSRHLISGLIGKEAAEWDFFPVLGGPEYNTDSRIPVDSQHVYCDDIRSPFNLGSVIRTAAAYGCESVYTSPGCPAADHPRVLKSAMGCGDFVRTLRTDSEKLDALMDSQPVFALELGGTELSRFSFPRKGMVVIGSEELGVSPYILGRCKASAGIVSIPLYGPKASLNVAVSFGILMQAWSQALILYHAAHDRKPMRDESGGSQNALRS